MIRTKWFVLSLGLPFDQLGDIFNRNSFSRGQTSGFELISIQNTSLRGKYIEELISNEVFIDPFGEEIVNVVRRFLIFEFQIFSLKENKVLLRVNTPPRSLKSFISTMAEIFGFDFSVEPLDIDILALIKKLKALNDKYSWVIRKVRVSSIRLNETSLARVEVVSEKDAFQDLRRSIKVNNAVLERATVEFNDGELINQLEVSSAGSISGEQGTLDKLTPAFRAYFS